MTSKPYKFPTAVHTYFQASNKLSEKKKFLLLDGYVPDFHYPYASDGDLLYERYCQLEVGEYASKSLHLICASYRLRLYGDNLADYRQANIDLYNTPNEEYVDAILGYYRRLVTQKDEAMWFEIEQILGKEFDKVGGRRPGPTDASFEIYQSYLMRYIDLPNESQKCVNIIEELLDKTGLSLLGWKTRLLKGTTHAKTHHSSRRIAIGRNYQPRTHAAGLRIGVHEVIGHALRGEQKTISESEGFAIVLEQLTDSKFVMRRSYRYLAVALGWGVLGVPMTFRQVFEVMWRVMMIGSRYNLEVARSYAFDECYRAFRGGKPDMAGAVLLKDMVYFDANIKMWKVLEENPLSYSQFVDVIEGRGVVLS